MAFDTLASQQSIDTTIASLKAHNIDAVVVANKEEALAFIKNEIPQGASVMNGSSTTLQQIGFIDYLKSGEHGWNNLHAAIVAEQDPQAQAALRQQALSSDYYLGSVHALSETGEMVIASNSGSQLPHLVFTSKHLLLPVSTKKITASLETALARLKEHVFPLEDARMKATGAPGSMISKVLLFEREPVFTGRTVKVILIQEDLGF